MEEKGMGLEALSVGRKYAPAKLRSEGAYLSVDESGIILWLNYYEPTSKEIRAWTTPGEIDIRFVVLNDLFFFMAKVPGQNWVDAPFCPQIANYRLPEIMNESDGYALTIMMTDGRTAIIKGLRIVGMNNEFSKELKKALDQINQLPIDIDEYDYLRKSIIASYSSADLAANADHKCALSPE